MTNDIRYTLRYSDEIHKKVEQEAKSLGISVASMIRIILHKHFNKNSKPKN